MEEDVPIQTPQVNKFQLQQKQILYIVAIIIFLMSIVGAGAYYIGRSVATKQYRINTITPTPTIQTISPTLRQINQPQTSPTKSTKQCGSNSDCPDRQGCFLYQCVDNKCRKINMCNQE